MTTSASGLIMDFYLFSGLINGIFPPTSGLVVGLYPFSGLINKFLPHQWFDIGLHPDNNLIQLQCYYPPMKITECLYGDVSPPPILLVQFC